MSETGDQWMKTIVYNLWSDEVFLWDMYETWVG